MAKKYMIRGPFHISNEGTQEFKYAVPEWNEDTGEEVEYVTWRGDRYFLDEFVHYNGADELKEFGIHGIHGLNAFAGLGIKINHSNDGATLYYFYS